MPQIAVVGDIHGEIRPLDRVIKWINAWDGKVIFAGDYVNRGPHSREVIDALVSLQADLGQRGTFLLGNHDLALREFLTGSHSARFLAHGGLTTLNSYLGRNAADDPYSHMRDSFPASHRRFLDGLASYWESSDMIVSHAGIDPARPSSRADADLVLGSHPELFQADVVLPKMVVSGHYAQRSCRPFVRQRFVCVDSGCGTILGAPLSVVVFPSRNVITF